VLRRPPHIHAFPLSPASDQPANPESLSVEPDRHPPVTSIDRQRVWSDGFSTAAWVLGALLLWIVILPHYLVRRGKAPLKGSAAPPVEPALRYAPAPTQSEAAYQPPPLTHDASEHAPLAMELNETMPTASCAVLEHLQVLPPTTRPPRKAAGQA
jgi:hypothetical protein